MSKRGGSLEIDVLSALTISLFSLIFVIVSSSVISMSSLSMLDKIDEQSTAVRIIESLCLSPGVPGDWEEDSSRVKYLGLALTNRSSYVLSRRKVEVFFRNFTLFQILSLLDLPNETYSLKFVLKPFFLSKNSVLELGDDVPENGFISSRMVLIDGSLFIFRVYVKRVS